MATIEITMENLQSTVESGGIVLLDFWADWCAPCRMFSPVFEQAALDHPDMVFGKVDTQAQPELAAGFSITSIPTLMAFRDGILVFSQPGMMRGPQLESLIEAISELDMEQVRAEAEELAEAKN